MCIDVFIDICIDMRMHACIDMGIDMCIHMHIHMHIHMRIHMCVGMCIGMFELAVTSKKRDAILGAILTSNWFLAITIQAITMLHRRREMPSSARS